MKETLDYSFEVSISTDRFDHKPTDSEVKKLRFKKTTTDVGEFLNYMLDGYCYAPIFSSDSFDMDGKNNKDFRYSYFVSIDVDHSSETMNDMLDRLDYKPTFAYTSCNNGLDGESRFRLVYCFDDKIESVCEYKGLVLSIFNANGLDINEEVGFHKKKRDKVFKYDRGSKEACRYFNGNGTDTFEFTTTDIIYSKEDFNYNNTILYNNVYSKITNKGKSVNENHIQEEHYNMNLNGTFEDKQFEEDYWSMRIGDIITKYQPIYPNIEHTPLPKVDDDTPYILFPSDYIEIRRHWTKKDEGRAIKWMDGEGRRHKLFVNGILRRRINPSITFDNLLYNLLYELYYYISNYNAKNIIGKKEIFDIAKNVMDADLSLISVKGTDRKYMVNRGYCIKYNLSPNQVKNIAAKAIKGNQIGELYDCCLTDKQNCEVMKENGLKVSIRTLKRWRKENGITKYKNK